MFKVCVNALASCALNDVGSHYARQKPVFGIIFEVSAAELRTVQIHCGSVPAGIRSAVALFVAD